MIITPEKNETKLDRRAAELFGERRLSKPRGDN